MGLEVWGFIENLALTLVQIRYISFHEEENNIINQLMVRQMPWVWMELIWILS